MIFGPNIEEFNELLGTQIVNESRAATIRNGKNNCIIYVSQELGRNACNMLSYFKYKVGTRYNRSSPVARISFRGPGYIYHKHGEDGPLYELTNTEYNNLTNTLKLPAQYDDKYENIWQELIHKFNVLNGTEKYESIMFYSKNNVDLTLNFVPLDQPIPDYSLLKNKVYYSGNPRK